MSAGRQTSGLPAEATSFVGRRAELARLVEAATMRRLVTVTGAGGVGKTRLVRQTARRLAGGYPDGVCLVEVSVLQAPDLLAPAVGAALGISGLNGRQAIDTVLAYLRERSVLLILDTCEHLIGTCGEFARRVSREAPEVTVLATSRQPLGVPGEWVFPLLPLPVPESGAELSEGDAADLFAQRAASAVPGFALDDGNRADVVRICQRLAGIPLALELAAVRLRALSVRELVEGFGLDMATGTRRTALTRHRDLRTAIGWSYELCTGPERTLWRRLSLFPGSFGFDAVAETCGDAELDADTISDAIDGLVRKSVLTEDPVLAGGEGRYRLLDPIREFGAVELDASGGAAAFRDRYIAYYLGMARTFGKQAVSGDQLSRYQELRREHANIRGAMEYAFASPGNERAAIDIATSMLLYWHMAGMAWEGEYWVNRALDRCPRPSPLRARILVVRSYLMCVLGEVSEGREDAVAGIKMGEQFGDTDTVARGYVYLNRALIWSDDLAAASSIAETAYGLLESEDDMLGLAQFQMHTVLAHLQARDLIGAAEAGARGLARLPAGELWATGYLLGMRGIARFMAGEHEKGTAEVRRAVAMKHELGDMVGVAYCVGVLGLMAAEQGRNERSAWLLGAAETLWKLAGRRYTGNAFLEGWHQRAVSRARAELGEDRYQQLWQRGVAAGPDALALFAVTDADNPAGDSVAG